MVHDELVMGKEHEHASKGDSSAIVMRNACFMIKSTVDSTTLSDAVIIYSVENLSELVQVHAIYDPWRPGVFNIRSRARSRLYVVDVVIGRVNPNLKNTAQFLKRSVRTLVHYEEDMTHSKEWHKVRALQVSSLGICKLRPYFLEVSHLFTSDRFSTTSWCLEHVWKVLDNNTWEMIRLQSFMKSNQNYKSLPVNMFKNIY
jgi:hypothetical protein